MKHAQKFTGVDCVVTDILDQPKTPKSIKNTATSTTAKKYLNAAKGTPIYPGIIIALFCGLRRSEICALDWSDIDWMQSGTGYFGCIHITKGYHERKGGGGYFSLPKSEKSIGRVLLPEKAGMLLCELKGTGAIMTSPGIGSIKELDYEKFLVTINSGRDQDSGEEIILEKNRIWNKS